MAERFKDKPIETDEDVPESIRRYRQIIRDNNKGGLYDIDDDYQDPNPVEEDVMMRDNGDVIYIPPGRGRGLLRGYNPGPCIDNIPQMIRKVNPSGYFEDTEKLSRAFNDKVKRLQSSYLPTTTSVGAIPKTTDTENKVGSKTEWFSSNSTARFGDGSIFDLNSTKDFPPLK